MGQRCLPPVKQKVGTCHMHEKCTCLINPEAYQPERGKSIETINKKNNHSELRHTIYEAKVFHHIIPMYSRFLITTVMAG